SGDLLDALDAAASWEAWDRLRSAQHLSIAAARRVMATTLSALLSAPGSTSTAEGGADDD
ncbi:MAG TPA: hypothetical protein VGO78_21460, partial [Acidimicrobiales bacterium]|nr:hypothetical protein [Acidimicrobiales bacterium]